MKKPVMVKMDPEIWKKIKSCAALEHKMPHEWVEEAIVEKLGRDSNGG